jgi:hypothetical protein
MDFLDSIANDLTEGTHLDELYLEFHRALDTR